ncbi:2080_t:CDS:2, partial [Dentiscutata heterogama]
MDQFTGQFAYTPALFIDYAPPSQDKKINSRQSKTSNKYEFVESEPDSDEVIPSKFWKDSETRALLSLLAENFDMYRKNKTKFYATAAIKIGNNRTSTQVNDKIQSLRSRYEKENKEETGKARSKWPYLDEMNELFGNRENHTESDIEDQ